MSPHVAPPPERCPFCEESFDYGESPYICDVCRQRPTTLLAQDLIDRGYGKVSDLVLQREGEDTIQVNRGIFEAFERLGGGVYQEDIVSSGRCPLCEVLPQHPSDKMAPFCFDCHNRPDRDIAQDLIDQGWKIASHGGGTLKREGHDGVFVGQVLGRLFKALGGKTYGEPLTEMSPSHGIENFQTRTVNRGAHDEIQVSGAVCQNCKENPLYGADAFCVVCTPLPPGVCPCCHGPLGDAKAICERCADAPNRAKSPIPSEVYDAVPPGSEIHFALKDTDRGGAKAQLEDPRQWYKAHTKNFWVWHRKEKTKMKVKVETKQTHTATLTADDIREMFAKFTGRDVPEDASVHVQFLGSGVYEKVEIKPENASLSITWSTEK